MSSAQDQDGSAQQDAPRTDAPAEPEPSALPVDATYGGLDGVAVDPAEGLDAPAVPTPIEGVRSHIAATPALAPSSSTPEERDAHAEKARSMPMTGEFEPLADADALPELPLPGPPLEQPPFARRDEPRVAFWKGQIRDYEREIEALGQDPRAATLALEVGRIYEEYLGRPRNAATSYQRAFTLDPKSPAVLHASRRLFTEVGNWGMVLEILGFEVQGATNPELEASLLAEKGLIQEEKLKDLDAARASFEAALEVWRAEPIAVAALEQIHLVRKQYADLEKVYVRAIEATEKPERKLPLLVAAAQLAEDRLDDRALAIARYEAVLEVDPEHTLALDALRRLYLATEDWAKYVEVLARAAALAPDEEAGQLLLTAARTKSEKLGQPDQAVLTLLKALERVPEDITILREIERLYAENERYDEVVKVLRREVEITDEPRELVPILVKLGSLLEGELEDADGAIEALTRAVDLMPTYTPAKQALGRLLGRLGRHEALALLFEKEARLEEDEWVKVSKLFQLADLRLRSLDDTPGAIAALQQALLVRRDYQPARKLLEDLLTRTESWDALADLYEQELETVQDKGRRVFLLTRIGSPARNDLVAPERAKRAYARILELEPTNLHALRSLQSIAEREADWSEVLRLLELEAEATEDQREVVAILHRAGTLREQSVQDAEGALEDYEKALTLNPSYLPALRSLGRLYGKLGRHDDLLAMYRRELDVARSSEQKVQLLFRSADVQAEQLGDLEGAAESLEQIIELDPENLPALRALAGLRARSGAHDALVEALEREAKGVAHPKEQADLLMQAAEILEEKLGRGDQAAEIYQRVIRLGHSVDNAIRALVRIYSVEGLWNALGQALATAKEHAEAPRAKVAILLRLAEVAGDRLGNLDRAVEHLEEALAIEPENVTILSLLERASVARRDWPRALAVGKKIVLAETDPRQFAARQIRLARLKETQLDPPESGAEHYRLALHTIPNHPVALRALELAYRRAGDYEALRRFYEREAFVSKDPVAKAWLYARAGDLCEHRLGDLEAAGHLYERALENEGALPQVLRGRRRVAQGRGLGEVALDSIRREGELAADPERKQELLFEAGRVYEESLGQLEPAVESYRSILAVNPAHDQAFERLERIYREGERTDELVALYEARVEVVRDVSEQARLLFEAGQVSEQAARAAGQPDQTRAIGAYQRALERAPDHADTLVRLGPLLFDRQDWDAAIDVFHRTLAVTKEPSVRRTALDALGIIYHEHRQDLVKCVQSLQAALQYDPADVESLTRLAKVYQEAQDWTSSVNVLLRLADVQQDLRGKVQTLLDLAELYETRLEDPKSAILANRKVLEIEATNQPAILRLVRLHERQGDWQALADVAARYVSLLPPDQKAKAAPLHLKMADVFEKRMGDDGRAINALKYALEADPDSQGALLKLAELYGKSPQTAAQAVEAHRRLLRMDPFRVQSYHEMHRLFERRGEHDKAFVVAEILVFLRAAHQDEELYYQEHKAKVAPHPERALTAVDHDRMVTHPWERGALRAVMELLSADLVKAFPGDLSPYELNRSSDRHGPKSAMALRRLSDDLAEALGGVPPYDIWVTKKYDLKVFTENERPLALVIGANVPRRIQEKDQRFLLGRALEQLKGGHHLLQRVPTKELEALMWATAKCADPSAQVPVDPASLDSMQRVLRSLPGRLRRLLEEVGSAIFDSYVDVERHRAAALHTGNRAGLVMSNDIEVAVRNVAKDHPDVRPVFRDPDGARETIGRIPAVRELLNYAVSDDYFAARTKLGFSIQA